MLLSALHRWLAWMLANPLPVIAVVVWLIANFAARPHPEDCTGWKKRFWWLVDRLCILTAAALPGKLKWLFAASPSLSPKTLSTEDDEPVVVDIEEEGPKDV